MNWWETVSYYLAEITTWTAVVDVLLVIAVIPWVLAIKKEPTSAIAWSLLVVFLPIVGVLLFILFGYQSVYRPLVRKRRHRSSFRETNPAGQRPAKSEAASAEPGETTWEGMGRLARQLDAYPITSGNCAELLLQRRSPHLRQCTPRFASAAPHPCRVLHFRLRLGRPRVSRSHWRKGEGRSRGPAAV